VRPRINQYTQRAVPGFADITGSAHSQAVVTVNNQPVTRQEGGYFHKALAVTNAASAAYQIVAVVGVRPNAGSNGNDVVTTETGAVFVAQTPEAFTYDADGNLLTDGRWTNTWDGEGRLIRAETLPGTSSNVPRQRLEFVYDSVGRRIKKTSLSGYVGGNYTLTNVTLQLWDGWLPVMEKANGLTNRFCYGLDLSGTIQGAVGVGGLLAVNRNGATYFTCADANGNVVLGITAGTSTTGASYEYTPWGQTIRATGLLASNGSIRFSTKCQDTETGWINFGLRLSDPSAGRFLSRDRLEERERNVNLYAFVDNSPVNKFDALGLSGASSPANPPDGFSCDNSPPLDHHHSPCCPNWAPEGGTIMKWIKMFKNDPNAWPPIVPKSEYASLGSEVMAGLGVGGPDCYGADFGLRVCRKGPGSITDPSCPSGKRETWTYKLRVKISKVKSAKCCDCYKGQKVDMNDITPAKQEFDTSVFQTKGACVK
jgi:RHS repeat-associated protein